MPLLLTTNPTITPAPITTIKGKLSVVKALIAVGYTPIINKINDPLIPGSSMAILAIHPAKNKPIAFKIVNVVIGSAALSGLKKAVIATKLLQLLIKRCAYL